MGHSVHYKINANYLGDVTMSNENKEDKKITYEKFLEASFGSETIVTDPKIIQDIIDEMNSVPTEEAKERMKKASELLDRMRN